MVSRFMCSQRPYMSSRRFGLALTSGIGVAAADTITTGNTRKAHAGRGDKQCLPGYRAARAATAAALITQAEQSDNPGLFKPILKKCESGIGRTRHLCKTEVAAWLAASG
jgi:hypothetical protein